MGLNQIRRNVGNKTEDGNDFINHWHKMTGQVLVEDLEPLDPLDGALDVDPDLGYVVADSVFCSRELWPAPHIERGHHKECPNVIQTLFNLWKAL